MPRRTLPAEVEREREAVAAALWKCCPNARRVEVRHYNRDWYGEVWGQEGVQIVPDPRRGLAG